MKLPTRMNNRSKPRLKTSTICNLHGRNQTRRFLNLSIGFLKLFNLLNYIRWLLSILLVNNRNWLLNHIINASTNTNCIWCIWNICCSFTWAKPTKNFRDIVFKCTKKALTNLSQSTKYTTKIIKNSNFKHNQSILRTSFSKIRISLQNKFTTNILF